MPYLLLNTFIHFHLLINLSSKPDIVHTYWQELHFPTARQPLFHANIFRRIEFDLVSLPIAFLPCWNVTRKEFVADPKRQALKVLVKVKAKESRDDQSTVRPLRRLTRKYHHHETLITTDFCLICSIYIYIYIYIYHYQVALTARSSLTLFHHPSLSSIDPGWSSRLHLVSTQR